MTPSATAVRRARGPAGQRGGAALAVCDQLRDHRVVRHPDGVPCRDAGVDPDPAGEGQLLERAGLREERARVLGIEPRLDRVPRRGDSTIDTLAHGDPEL